MKNPPSLKPLNTFGGYTSDQDYNKIEEWSGVESHNTLPGELSTSSLVEILDTDPNLDEYMVSEKLLTY
jgi:hypothetical protein